MKRWVVNGNIWLRRPVGANRQNIVTSRSFAPSEQQALYSRNQITQKWTSRGTPLQRGSLMEKRTDLEIRSNSLSGQEED